jgi:secondary thiamine-phosphate synthase enzyme
MVPDGDPLFEHDAEGPDDMPAHIRTILTNCSLTIPVSQNQLSLGTWQGVFLWEHRHMAHKRTIIITVSGEEL